MHRLAALPGGWTPGTEGVIFVDQTPAPLVVITAADTDISAIAQALTQLPADFPPLRTVNLLQLQQQLSIDTYADTVLTEARGVLVRLLGGRSYWSYGLEVVRETVARNGATLVVLPGDNQLDPALMSQSTLPLAEVTQGWRYFLEGGLGNMANALRWLAHHALDTAYSYAPPQTVPAVGPYPWPVPATLAKAPQVGIVFYRAHYLAGNTTPIDALCQALGDRHLCPQPYFVSSLRDADVQAALVQALRPPQEPGIQLLLNTTSFALGQPLDLNRHCEAAAEPAALWQQLDVPVLQTIFSGGSEDQWQQNWQGLSPRDVAMNVALPEVDGRIIGRAVSFKAVQGWNLALETAVLSYQPVGDRLEFTADLAARWVQLRQTPVGDRKVALILANYPTRNGRLANGVGLDTPASCVAILQALRQAGYRVENAPQTSEELIERLTAGATNDPETQGTNPVAQHLPLATYQAWFEGLPPGAKTQVYRRWGAPEAAVHSQPRQAFPIAGLQLGNVFVGIQPARGYDRDPALNYHAPDLEPTHDYLAFYLWLRAEFGTQALVHVGKHGNLEWLPGKSVALSADCFPEIASGPLPHFYPFIVNDPGEGSQAKRRSQAVILDHLTPPMTRAELYGGLQKLEGLIDEYYEAQTLNPSRLPAIRDRLAALIQQENLSQELQALTGQTVSRYLEAEALAALITQADRYLCELKESQIRDGLHIFGQCPAGAPLRDLIIAIARHPGRNRPGLTRAIATAWGLDFDPLTADPATPNPWSPQRGPYSHLAPPWRDGGEEFSASPPSPPEKGAGGEGLQPTDRPQPQPAHTLGDLIDRIETEAAQLIDALLASTPLPPLPPPLQTELDWIAQVLLPNLQQTPQEMDGLLHGLSGGYVPAGPSGAPTRGRPEVLPTGRNFYSVDIRAVPTESAWDVGRRAAELLIETYTQEHGEYPQTLALSVWGTATMRTGGDDLAEALALLGVQPVWEGISRRVVDFEVLPLAVLGRPRVDVTLRISGFFRDAFPNLIDLFNRAVETVAALEEPANWNPLAAQVAQETQAWQQAGLSPEQAQRRATYRAFGSKPGAYGAGLQGLLESQAWETSEDLARAYLNWSSYAYTAQGVGYSEPEAFSQRLSKLQIVLQNQDNREHDLLDSDDYYQFQGGLTAAVRSLQGVNPTVYYGDHALPEQPKVRSLQAEIARVYRARVVNPKWIAGVMRHGYKGAFEMAATLDFLFGYDATAQCVPDHMYAGVAQAYLLDPATQAFVRAKNPWALRDMAERLLEAHQRGLWAEAEASLLAALRALALEAEAAIEGRLGGL